MSLFKVNMPLIPNDVKIHNISNTPSLKYAKAILIAVVASNILITLVVIMTMQSQESQSQILNTTMSFIAFVSLIATFFATFYISKLSLRRHIFNLQAMWFIIILIGSLMDKFLTSDTSSYQLWENGVPNITMLIYWSIALPIELYIIWQFGKELSFITHEAFFFKGSKIFIVGFIILLLALFLASIALIIKNSTYMFIGGIAVFIASLLIGTACIFYFIAIVRIHQVIAYGETINNPVS